MTSLLVANKHSLLSKLTGLEELLKEANNAACLSQIDHLLTQLESVVTCNLCQDEYGADPDRLETQIGRVQKEACRSFGLLEKELGRQRPDAAAVARYLSTISQTALKEAKSLEVNHRSKILFIGCGARPTSCHALSAHFGCQVVGVDTDSESVELAEKYASYVAQGSRLKFLQSDGAKVALDGFSHVMVASLVQDKKSVLDHIADNAEPDVRVAARFGEGLQRVMNYQLPELSVAPWKSVSFQLNPRGLYQTIYLRRS